MSDIVIAFYSRTGVTRAVAHKLAALLGADVEAIEESASRSGPIGWLRAGRDAMLSRSGELTSRHSLSGRRAAVLGMPVWAACPPPAIRAYLEAVDVSEVKVFAFCTYDGAGAKKLLDNLAESVPGGLAGSLALKKPAKNPDLDAKLEDFAEQIRPA